MIAFTSPRVEVPESARYWTATDARIKHENWLDRRAAADLNADWLLINTVPFGSQR